MAFCWWFSGRGVWVRDPCSETRVPVRCGWPAGPSACVVELMCHTCDVPPARGQDITQQHLCDPVTVSLIEKCARLHIHCAHFMCEEPMSSFDTKINNENMTKCLQSLKEMYQDLRGKGVCCAREAEFQGYSVLLSLNKGDTLR